MNRRFASHGITRRRFGRLVLDFLNPGTNAADWSYCRSQTLNEFHSFIETNRVEPNPSRPANSQSRRSVRAFGPRISNALLSIAISFLVSTIVTAQAPNRVLGNDFHDIAWANPAAKGTKRVLVVAPRFTLADATALARHMECQLSTAPLWSRTELGGPVHHAANIPDSNDRDTLAMLRDRFSKKYDLIIAANFDFRILPDSIVDALADAIGDGTGLLLANVDPTVDPRWANSMTPLDDPDVFAQITRGIGELQTPAWGGGLEFLKLTTLGAGHIAWLNYPGASPATHCLQPLNADIGIDSDFSANYFSLIVRCAHWAAGVKQGLHITGIDELKIATADEEAMPTGLLREEVEAFNAALASDAAKRFDVRLSDPADRTFNVRTRTRRPGDPGAAIVVDDYEDHVRKGETSFPVYVVAGSGDYFFDVWILDGTEVVDWFTQFVTINQWPRIDDIEFEKPWIAPTDSLAINGIIEKNEYQPHPVIVRARAYDTAGRRLAESQVEVPADAYSVRLVLELEEVTGPIVRVEVAALNQTGIPRAPAEFNVAATRRAVLPVFDTTQIKSYDLLAHWSVADQSVSRSAFNALRDLGLDGVHLPAGGSAAYDASASGLRPMIGARMARDIDQSGIEQGPLFFNPRIEPILDIVRYAAPIGASPFLLQQSIAPAADKIENPNYATSYRNAVQRDYHNIDTVNAVWRTDFVEWVDIKQPTRRDAMRTRNFEPWMRYQTAIDETQAANWDIIASLMRQAFDSARIGFDFSDPFPHESIDWRSTAAILATPDPLTVERTRSYLAPPADGILIFPEVLLEDDSAFGPWLPWYGLFHGFNQAVWPDAIGQADRVPPGLLLNADGAPYSETPPALQEVMRIKSGIGTLMLEADRFHCGIAIYDSRASEHLNAIDASFETQSTDAQRSLVALLESLGYQYDFISPANALNGVLDEYRLLILPMIRSLSEDEIHAIRAFQRDGGALVADVAPGQFDENGIPRDVLPFDDLFGVQHPRPVEAAGPNETVVELQLGGDRVTADLPAVYTDSSVEPIDANVGGMANHVPTWILRSDDAGRGLLLNHAFPPYRDPDGATERGMRVLMRTLLAQWAVLPAIDVQTRNSFFGETVYWKYGDAQIVSLLAHPLQQSDATKIRVDFPKSYRVYDRLGIPARSKKGSIDFELSPGQPAILVGLPYEVRSIDLETAASVVPGERLPFQLSLKTGKVKPGRHLIRVELVPPLNSPFGTRVKYLEASGGIASGRIRLALNDRRGIYVLRAQDLLTGVAAERTIQVGTSAAANQPFSIGR